VLAVRGAFIMLVVGPLVYGIYYPQPYLNQILRKTPIVVVDNDLSELSRNIMQTLDASGAVRVAARADTLADAHALLDRGEAFAVVGIPPGTERDVLKGIRVHVPIYADATYLFIFRTLSNGIAVAINTVSSELAAGGARTDGSLVKAALASSSPADVLLQPIFNPVGGYASYVVLAGLFAFYGGLGSGQFERFRTGSAVRGSTLARLSGTAAHLPAHRYRGTTAHLRVCSGMRLP
jgi:ABC-2 type transport system permease protein